MGEGVLECWAGAEAAAEGGGVGTSRGGPLWLEEARAGETAPGPGGGCSAGRGVGGMAGGQALRLAGERQRGTGMPRSCMQQPQRWRRRRKHGTRQGLLVLESFVRAKGTRFSASGAVALTQIGFCLTRPACVHGDLHSSPQNHLRRSRLEGRSSRPKRVRHR